MFLIPLLLIIIILILLFGAAAIKRVGVKILLYIAAFIVTAIGFAAIAALPLWVKIIGAAIPIGYILYGLYLAAGMGAEKASQKSFEQINQASREGATDEEIALLEAFAKAHDPAFQALFTSIIDRSKKAAREKQIAFRLEMLNLDGLTEAQIKEVVSAYRNMEFSKGDALKEYHKAENERRAKEREGAKRLLSHTNR